MEVVVPCGSGVLRRAMSDLKSLASSGRVTAVSSTQVSRARSNSPQIQLLRLAEQRDGPDPAARLPRPALPRQAGAGCGLLVRRSPARLIALTATGTAPRRRARVAVSSSSTATSSCSPVRRAARCRARRSGWSASVSASASCARRRSTRSALRASAERISNSGTESFVDRRRQCLQRLQFGRQRDPGRSPVIVRAAPRISPIPSSSFRAATSRTVRVASGRSNARAANARSRRSVNAGPPGTDSSFSGTPAADESSTRARGFPAASRTHAYPCDSR